MYMYICRRSGSDSESDHVKLTTRNVAVHCATHSHASILAAKQARASGDVHISFSPTRLSNKLLISNKTLNFPPSGKICV